MNKYKIESKKGEGTYSIVYLASDKQTNEKYALKVMKYPYKDLSKIKKDKEIKALHMFTHPNIIKLIDVLYDEKQQRMGLLFELMDSNLYEYYKNKKTLSLERIKNIVFDLLTAVQHIHRKGIFHRDIKPENILMLGERTVKLADFGSYFFSKLPYTQYISTRWYRAPECLMTDGYYSEKMDVWSLGCILFELFALYPLFPGKSQIDQIKTIFSVLGTPAVETLKKFQERASHLKLEFEESDGIGIEGLIPNAPKELIDLIEKMLMIDPEIRLSIDEAMNHPFFFSLTELKKYQNKVISKIVENKQLSLPSLKVKKN